MIVTTFATLKRYMEAFADGNISLLVIRSAGGLGKSYLAKQLLDDEICSFFNGHATPLSIYMRLLSKPDNLVVFDDVDSLLFNKISIALLKQFCETTEDKTIRYSTTHKIDGSEVKASFISHNKVMLLCNDFKRVGRNIKALITRGIYIDFQPSKEEILMTLTPFATDIEIFGYIKLNKDDISELNFRVYLKCVELKKAKIDWKGYLAGEFKISRERELALQLKDMPINDRNATWESETGKSPRSLQRLLKRMEEK